MKECHSNELNEMRQRTNNAVDSQNASNLRSLFVNPHQQQQQQQTKSSYGSINNTTAPSATTLLTSDITATTISHHHHTTIDVPNMLISDKTPIDEKKEENVTNNIPHAKKNHDKYNTSDKANETKTQTHYEHNKNVTRPKRNHMKKSKDDNNNTTNIIPSSNAAASNNLMNLFAPPPPPLDEYNKQHRQSTNIIKTQTPPSFRTTSFESSLPTPKHQNNQNRPSSKSSSSTSTSSSSSVALLNMFQPPSPPQNKNNKQSPPAAQNDIESPPSVKTSLRNSIPKPELTYTKTERTSNTHPKIDDEKKEASPLLPSDAPSTTTTPLVSSYIPTKSNDKPPPPPPTPPPPPPPSSSSSSLTPTILGSLLFLLYHVVFSLSIASSLHSNLQNKSLLPALAQIATLSVFSGGFLNLYLLGGSLPALYPSCDLFMIPFVTSMARNVEDVLLLEQLEEEEGLVFLTTWSVLVMLGLMASGGLCWLGGRVKLANVGAFLPYSVLSGFFTAVSVVLWTVGFGVDTQGLSVGELVLGQVSDVREAWWRVLVHHVPSMGIGALMFVLGPRHPLYITVIIGGTVVGVYVVMGICGMTLEMAQDGGWFFSSEELVPFDVFAATGVGRQEGGWNLDWWVPPLPFGVFNAIRMGYLHVPALVAGLPTIAPMAFIYALRCSLHAAALKKVVESYTDDADNNNSNSNISKDDNKQDSSSQQQSKKPAKLSEPEIFSSYGISIVASMAMGGTMPTIPCLGGGITMHQLGAGGVPPQIGSMLLLIPFYVTGYRWVAYLPKMVFSSLIYLMGYNLAATYFVKSFFKTKNKAEWSVVPLILVLNYVVGSLGSVMLGVAFSMFIFVGSFYRTGVVKFLSNALTVRSTIERNVHDSQWLDQNGDLIQILVLQNYLFFGNATSCRRYIESMFEDVVIPSSSSSSSSSSSNKGNETTTTMTTTASLPPFPKSIILDFTLVTGMDTSAVDVVSEIVSLCKRHDCSIYLSGLNYDLRSTLSYGGVRPTPQGRPPQSSSLRAKKASVIFCPDLDSALGKAEDALLVEVHNVEERDRRISEERRVRRIVNKIDDGFLYALEEIDEQHGIDFTSSLSELKDYVVPIMLKPGQRLADDNGRMDACGPRGLYFIEHGLMRVERDNSYSLTRRLNNRSYSKNTPIPPLSPYNNNKKNNSIGQLKARTATMGKNLSNLKSLATSSATRDTHTFRLARIGAGWVVGSLETSSGLANPGTHVAVTDCRLHHLRSDVIKELERKDPRLILSLFKLMSYVTARRQDITIEQLATLQSIVASRGLVPGKEGRSVDRMTMAAIQNAITFTS